MVDPAGEILITARVNELNNENSITFNQSDIKNKGRVIFYSEDVRGRGQYLNFSNLPIYGPITYDGNSLYLEFNILELDNAENAQTKVMLSTLAELGSTAYPPASVALGILDTLGNSLLSGDQDDIEFRYHMTLVPTTDEQSALLNRPFLREGIYVFLRSENRTEDLNWDKLRFDVGTGRLMEGDGKNFYRKGTYLVVQITKGGNSDNLDRGQTVANFFSKYKSDNIENLKSLTTRLKNSKKIKYLEKVLDKLSKSKLGIDSNENAQRLEAAAEGLCAILSGNIKATDEQIFSLINKLSKAHNIIDPKKVTIGKIKPYCEESTITKKASKYRKLWN
jgi:hypothetical protein